MPRYTYRCDNCKEVFEVSHGMFFVQQRCIKCHCTECLEKLPDVLTVGKLPKGYKKSNRSGQVVDKFIEDAKKDLKTQKDAAKREHRDD